MARKIKAAGTAADERKLDEATAELAAEMKAEERRSETEILNLPEEVPIGDEFRRIVETVFVPSEDLFDTYERLERDLRDSAKVGQQVVLLEVAETNWRSAHRLWISARVERERWEADNQVAHATLRDEATKSLQREKDAGWRSKQITDADVIARCAQLFPDEWRAVEQKRLQYKLTEDSLAHLVEAWGSKCRSLQTMVSRGR